MKTYDSFCMFAAVQDKQETLPAPALPLFFQLPRELRDAIYEHHIEDQVSTPGYSRSVFDRKRCGGCRKDELVYWTARKHSFTLLLVNRQLMHELQQTLIKKGFTLHFYCACHLLSFFKRPKLYPIQQELTSLYFHWRGEASGYPPAPQDAIAKLQTLPALTHLAIRITESLPLPEPQRAHFLECSRPSPRDFCFAVADAIGFDELVSLRGLEDVRLIDVDYCVGAAHEFSEDILGLKECLESHLKREKPPVHPTPPPFQFACQLLMRDRDTTRSRRYEHRMNPLTNILISNGLDGARRAPKGHLKIAPPCAVECIQYHISQNLVTKTTATK
ncbi:hypothetical protein BGZ57DRAFT_454092 [Hyaloscypha finlandica]|nr:hypothetical protein BGZ57DRAFT_454092 [Hyaloscypha finlandica]